ncbi:hypothetical protein LTR78_003194 [Recurvomyces mirabilis]|uniref:Peroxisomal adenine nucleotide transporter 1 n=1 Tax=Recurvomyces mirabilis TaxID=574656 RepID=A0AAE0WS35_9PEZI|nr:hypothetical protein LTR78_003194 [Recurvomyces mirabilis]KAK5156986.1 hypothetical protein LTS14_004503 [Recurvomyces mirabilis]
MSEAGAKYRSDLDSFEAYHEVQDSHHSNTGPALPALGHAVAGAIATAGSKALLYPIELITTRLQVQRQLRGSNEAPSAGREARAEYKSFLDAAQKIYRDEGLGAFYTGCAPDVGKGIADSFLFFLAYSYLHQHQLRKDGTKHLSVFKELAVGGAAGVSAKLVTTPLQNIITRQQTAALVAARDPNNSKSPSESDKQSIQEIGRQIYNERGLAGFWAGYSASVILTMNPAITFAVDNLLKRLLPTQRRDNPSPQVTFLLAAISKAIATSITYPVMLAKSRAQAASPSNVPKAEGTEKKAPLPQIPGVTVERDVAANVPVSDDTKEKVDHGIRRLLRLFSAQYAIFLSLRKIYRNEGLGGLYSGIEGEVLKGFLSHGLTMVVKEKAHVLVIQTYYLLLRLTKRWPDDAKDMAAEARERVEAAGTRVAHDTKTVINDVKERSENAAVTMVEGAKQLSQDGGKNILSQMPQNAKGLTEDVKERVESVSTTVAQGAKQALAEGKKAISGDKE